MIIHVGNDGGMGGEVISILEIVMILVLVVMMLVSVVGVDVFPIPIVIIG